MALSKTFPNNAVLTAQDVNTHLVNHVPNPGDPYETDWVNLDPYIATGFTTPRLQAKRTGMMFRIRGIVEGDITDGTVNITSGIPALWRPTENEFAGAYLSGGFPCTLLVRPNGVLAIINRWGTKSGAQFSITFAK